MGGRLGKDKINAIKNQSRALLPFLTLQKVPPDQIHTAAAPFLMSMFSVTINVIVQVWVSNSLTITDFDCIAIASSAYKGMFAGNSLPPYQH